MHRQLCCALPLRFHVTRNIIDEIIVRRFELDNHSDWALRGINAAVTFIIVASAAILAILSDSLHVVIGLTSAVCASFVIYILPAKAYYTLLQKSYPSGVPLSEYVYLRAIVVAGCYLCGMALCCFYYANLYTHAGRSA